MNFYDFLKWIFDDFWRWVGFMLMLYCPVNFILQIIHKNIRARTIREKRYPPPHCDGDGDAYEDE